MCHSYNTGPGDESDGPLNLEVEVREGMEMNKMNTAVINVTTAVKSTTTEFVFGTA